MNTPSTPSRKPNGFNDILMGLNMRWGFELPIHDVHKSPSKIGNRRSLEHKVSSQIKFLYFQNRPALHGALNRFNQDAPFTYFDWVTKPEGDLDTLPAAIRQGKSHAFPFEHALSPEHTAKYLELLFKLLSQILNGNDALITGLSEAEHTISLGRQRTVPSDADTTDLLRDDDERPLRRGTIHEFRAKISTNPEKLVARYDPSSSENFGSWHEEDDQTMIEFMQSNSSVLECTEYDKVEQDIQSFPTLDETVRKGSNINQMFLSQQENIPVILVDKSSARKRPSAGHDTSISPKKVSLGTPATSAERPFLVLQHNPLQPAQLPVPVAQLPTSVSTSFTSVGSSQISLEAGPETTATSFGSTVSNAHHERIQSPKPKSKNCVATSFNFRSVEANASAIPIVNNVSLKTLSPSETVLLQPDQSANATDASIPKQPLFGESRPLHDIFEYPRSYEYRLIYEVTRIAQHAKVRREELIDEIKYHPSLDLGDISKIYQILGDYLSRSSKALPQWSSLAAWTQATGDCDRVAFTGDLEYSSAQSESIFNFNLKPLKLDKSYRLARKFGAHRFLIVGLPGLERKSLPSHLTSKSDCLKGDVIDWLINGEHTLLGRKWKAFYLRRQETNSKSRKEARNNPNAILYQVFFFATDGYGFVPKGSINQGGWPIKTSITELLKWFMPLNLNKDKSMLKLFARLQIGVSSTTETLEFQTWQIVRCDDTYSDQKIAAQRLDISRSNDKKKGDNLILLSDSKVMNDGCARISFEAAKHIAMKLQLDYIPSAFQGRIAGAKGMWMVDYTNETLPDVAMEASIVRADLAVWIEVTDSQLKFNSRETNLNAWTDSKRRTFEVNAYSRTLKPARLNFQLMSILTEQGVTKQALEKLLKEDLMTKTSSLKLAMSDPVALRVWSQENSPISGRRTQSNGIDWLGGMPDDVYEKINCLVEHGFHPKECRLLSELCCEETKKYCTHLSERMHVEVGQSTYAFMLADPIGVLEENEVHFGFSTRFQDSQSGFSDTLLENVDILVARLPASLPSDIQKVRARFKSELAKYKDVIIFSIKGKLPLAEKLSGGDYDGDKAWVCWEPGIVEKFRSCEPSPQPHYSSFGIIKKEYKVHGEGNENEISNFLRVGFEFSLQPSLLGIVTHYYESLVYDLHKKGKRNCVNLPVVKEIGQLLGYLVDAAKNGFVYGESDWHQYKAKKNLPQNIPKPAFMTKDGSIKPNPEHIIDYLKFVVSEKVIHEELTDLAGNYVNTIPLWDHDLASIAREEERFVQNEGKQFPILRKVLEDLIEQLESLHEWWARSAASYHDDDSRRKTFIARVQDFRSKFLDIKPLRDLPITNVRWASCSMNQNHWSLLKASLLYTKYPRTNSIWYACGRELCEIKVIQVSKGYEIKSSRPGGMRSMVQSVHNIFRPDGKLYRKLEEKAVEETAEEPTGGDEDDEEDDDHGGISSDEFYSVMSDMGYF